MLAPRLSPVWGRLLRGLLGRCPRCRGRGWRVRWFGRLDRCRDCGYRYARSPGFSLGAVTMNMIATVLAMVPVTIGCFVVLSPNVRPLPVALALGVVAVGVPILFQPLSYTTWAAVDLSMNPLDPIEEADAATWLAAQAAGPERPGPVGSS